MLSFVSDCILRCRFVAFLLGKLLIYTASALYHLVEWRSLDALRLSHAVDLSLIPVMKIRG